MGAAQHFSTEQSQFLVSHLLSYCPARFEHVQSEPARESPEEANSLASRPKASSGWRKRLPQWEREGLRASFRFRLAYRRLNAGHWLVGNGNVLVCAPELEHRPDPKIENIEALGDPRPWHSKRAVAGGIHRGLVLSYAAQTAVVSASFPNTRKRAAAGRRAADLLKIDSKAVVGDVGDDAAVQTRRAE